MTNNRIDRFVLAGIAVIAKQNERELFMAGFMPCIKKKHESKRKEIDVKRVVALTNKRDYHGIISYIEELCL